MPSKGKNDIQSHPKLETVRAFFMMADDLLPKVVCDRETEYCRAKKRCDDCMYDYYIEQAYEKFCWRELELNKTLLPRKGVTYRDERERLGRKNKKVSEE